MPKDLTTGDDMLDILRRRFGTVGRQLGEAPQLDLRDAVRRLAELVLAQHGGRPGIGSEALEALQYAAAAIKLAEAAVPRDQVVVLTIQEAEELARRTGDYTLRHRCASTRALADVGKGLHTAKWKKHDGPLPLGPPRNAALEDAQRTLGELQRAIGHEEDSDDGG